MLSQDQEKLAQQQKTAREAEQERQWKQLQALRQQQAQQQQNVIHEQRVQGMAFKSVYVMMFFNLIFIFLVDYFKVGTFQKMGTLF